MIPDEKLIWKTRSEKTVLKTPVFDIIEEDKISASGIEGKYVALNAPKWVVVMAVHDENFVLVRQWRHGMGALTTEFPAGVAEEGEDPAETAYRELLEETGYDAGKITLLGSCNPNPALFKNTLYIYLAEDLTPTGKQHLDHDEMISVFERPIKDVIYDFASEDYPHAYMGTALALFLRRNL